MGLSIYNYMTLSGLVPQRNAPLNIAARLSSGLKLTRGQLRVEAALALITRHVRGRLYHVQLFDGDARYVCWHGFLPNLK